MVRDISILTGLDRFYPLLNVYSWYLKKKKFIPDIKRPGFLGGNESRAWPKKSRFLKIPISFALFFDKDNLGIDHVFEEMAATDG